MARLLVLSFLLLALLPHPISAQTVPTPAPRDPKISAQPTDPSLNDVETVVSAESADKRIYQSACPAVFKGKLVAKPLPPLSQGQCGERSPLEVTAVSGISLSTPAVMNCRTATSMANWMSAANETASRQLGTQISRVITSTSYQCRRRNNAPTGKISEHGFANAIDILGFEFSNGETVRLIDDWGSSAVPKSEETHEGADEITPAPEQPTTKQGIYLRTVRDLACDQFTTVLSPDSNPLHADHFHFDLGCHGKRCTYRICE